MKSAKILDSGERREFDTGAVRDMQEGKGRCDLMPLGVASRLMQDVLVLYDPVLYLLDLFNVKRETFNLYQALRNFSKEAYGGCRETMLLEVSKHFEEGAKKYGENNWQKGLPVSCYIDSAVRHYLKWQRGDIDEPHDRAFVWNIMCCIWELEFSPRAKTEEKKEEIKLHNVTMIAGITVTDNTTIVGDVPVDSPEYRAEIAQNIREMLNVDDVKVDSLKIFVHD